MVELPSFSDCAPSCCDQARCGAKSWKLQSWPNESSSEFRIPKHVHTTLKGTTSYVNVQARHLTAWQHTMITPGSVFGIWSYGRYPDTKTPLTFMEEIFTGISMGSTLHQCCRWPTAGIKAWPRGWTAWCISRGTSRRVEVGCRPPDPVLAHCTHFWCKLLLTWRHDKL